jgi:hypothetical protein
VLLGGLTLAFERFNASDESVVSSSGTWVLRTPHFSAKVVKLAEDTEAAFQQDDFTRARNNVRTLQQLAPNHPRLAFFELLLGRRGEAPGRESTAASQASPRTPARAGAATNSAPDTGPARATRRGARPAPASTSAPGARFNP